MIIIDILKKHLIKAKEDIYKNTNEIVISLLYKIGEYLNKQNIQIEELYEYLYKLYGNTIIFSKRSLIFSKQFYKKYHKVINMIPLDISWNNYVILMRKNLLLKEDIEILKIINLFSMTEKEISYFLNTGHLKRCFKDLSMNNIVIEFMNLKEKEE